jgi:RiboL-PSP-HEPN
MQNALDRFKSSLERVREIASEIDDRITSQPGNQRFRNATQTIICGSVVVTSGYFESFLSDLVKSYVMALNLKQFSFNGLPDKIQKTHYQDGAKFLLRIIQNQAPGHSTTREDVLRRLNTVLGPRPYELVWEAFANTHSNPGVETLESILKRCGISNPWEKLAEAISVKAEIIKSNLEGFITVRNDCAHTGTAIDIPATSTLLSYCDNLEKIATGVVKILSDLLAIIESQELRLIALSSNAHSG